MKVNKFLNGREPYRLPRTPGVPIKLDIVETLFPQSPAVTAAAAAAVCDLFRYPAADDTAVLSQLVQAYTQCQAEPIFTCGSDSALKLILDTLAVPDSVITLITPTYPHFQQMAECTPARIKLVPATCEQDILDRLDEIAQSDLVYIVSPNLPLGYVAPLAIERLAERTVVVADEAYCEYGPGSVARLVDRLPQLIVTRTFSKFFGLAALRIGYLLTGPRLRGVLEIMHNGKSVTRVAAVAATTALQNLSYYQAQIAEFAAVREWLRAELPRVMGSEITGAHIAYGNFMLLYARDPAWVTGQFATLAGIAVRDKSAEIPGAIRVSIAPLPVMRHVVRCIRHINRYPGCRFLVDLDGTLRPDSKLTSPLVPGAREFLQQRPCHVVTNNTVHTADAIRAQLGVDVPVIQPEPPTDYFVVARGWPNGEREWRGVCIMNSVLDVGTEMWSRASELIKRGLPVAVVEDCRTCPAAHASETVARGAHPIPDVGAFLDALGVESYQQIGKPFITVPHDAMTVVVGDGDRDAALAHRLGLDFIRVQPGAATRVGPDSTLVADISAICPNK